MTKVKKKEAELFVTSCVIGKFYEVWVTHLVSDRPWVIKPKSPSEHLKALGMTAVLGSTMKTGQEVKGEFEWEYWWWLEQNAEDLKSCLQNTSVDVSVIHLFKNIYWAPEDCLLGGYWEEGSSSEENRHLAVGNRGKKGGNK